MHTVTFLRKATKAKDGKSGFIYRHTWKTGFQDLVFASHKLAEDWAASMNGVTRATCKVTHALNGDPYKVGDEVTVKRIYFYNGENHVNGMCNGKQVDIPYTWTDL